MLLTFQKNHVKKSGGKKVLKNLMAEKKIETLKSFIKNVYKSHVKIVIFFSLYKKANFRPVFYLFLFAFSPILLQGYKEIRDVFSSCDIIFRPQRLFNCSHTHINTHLLLYSYVCHDDSLNTVLHYEKKNIYISCKFKFSLIS